MATNLKEYLAQNRPEGFRSVPMYFPSGDFLTYFLEDTPYHAERVNDVITVYLANDNGRLIGCKVKGVRHILQTAGDFQVDVGDGQVSLGFLIFVGAAPDRADTNRTWFGELKKFARVMIPRTDLQPA